MIDISNSSSMLEDWNKGVSCVGQSVQDVEVENVENDDGIEADNNQMFCYCLFERNAIFWKIS